MQLAVAVAVPEAVAVAVGSGSVEVEVGIVVVPEVLVEEVVGVVAVGVAVGVSRSSSSSSSNGGSSSSSSFRSMSSCLKTRWGRCLSANTSSVKLVEFPEASLKWEVCRNVRLKTLAKSWLILWKPEMDDHCRRHI